MLLNETHLSNQHVEIVRMFLNSAFFITELTALAYFTHHVSLPLLNFVEVNSQDKLLEIFPKLFQDLKNRKMDTLSDYLVEYYHVTIKAPTSETDHLLKAMCEGASKSILLQCGHKYGFGQETDAPVRAMQLHLLSKEDLAGLPTNNIPSERVFSVFDRKATAAKSQNKVFKAKSIRNDMILHQSSQRITEEKVKQITKVLAKREEDWNASQKDLHEKKIIKKLRKASNQSIYTTKLLQQCKQWSGPATSVTELELLQSHPDIQEQIVRIELAYYRDTLKSEIIYNADLFKINKVTHEERLTNFCVLLQGFSHHGGVTLPTNTDALKVLQGKIIPDTPSEDEVVVNEL